MQDYDSIYELKSDLRYQWWMVWSAVPGKSDWKMNSMKFLSNLKINAVWC